MKVLWFANSPCGSIKRNNIKIITGGWLISLEDEIKKCSDIDLNVAFFSKTEEAPFIFEGVRYLPIFIPSRKSKMGHILDRRKNIESIDKQILPIMIDIVNSVKPDLIHIHGTEQSFGLIQDYIKHIPVVFSIQGLLAPYTEKFYSGIPCTEVEKRETFLMKIRGIDTKRLYRSFYYRGRRECMFLKKAQYVLGRTSWDHNVTGLLNPDRKYYIVNEILRQPFYINQWKKEKYNDIIQIASIISPGIYKGFETLLQSAELLKKYTHLNFVWNVVGLSFDGRYERLCEDYTHIKACDVNVRYLGLQSADNLSTILVSSDIYCHVSHMENSPNSVCEAMLIGVPVLASYAGGTSSILEDGEEGYLIQDGDAYAIAGAIVKMSQNFDLCKKMGEKARRKALARHNPQNVITELTKSYKDILRRANGTSIHC